MQTIFRAALARLRGQILGWGVVMFLLSLITAVRYDIVRENQAAVEQLLQGSIGNYVKMFGDVAKLTTPEGFLSMALFSFLPLLLGVFAVLAGSGLLAADEEDGTLDLILAYPVSRTALFLGRLLALVTATLAILALSWLGFVVAMRWTTLSLGWGAMMLPYLSLWALVLFFGGLALLLSMVLPSRRLAAMTTGMLLIAQLFPNHTGAPRSEFENRRPLLTATLLPERRGDQGAGHRRLRRPAGRGGAVRRGGVVALRVPRHPRRRRGRLALEEFEQKKALAKQLP